uniref:TFIIS N-terminal domain-containing protein n=1 Tax=Knipowitschia caucasica TaxID=637954 RepID=A0AAV2JKQ8_KNICA
MASSTSELVDKIKRYKLHLTNDQEAAKIQKTLKKLKALEITVDVLAATGIGKIVNSLRRHELAGDLAKTLVRDWKKLLPKDSKSPTTDEFPCAIKLDKEKVVAADLNNNCLFDVKEVEPSNEPMKCLPVPVCPDSPIKITSQCIIQIPESPPLESWFPEVENNPKRKDDSYDILEESAVFTGQRLNKKMQVYSGAKTVFLPAMMSLYQQCIRTLQNNINLLYETGGVPFEILQPVLERCTPEQLLRIEEYNPIYIGETDHLWGKHCQRDFKDAKLLEYESWKEMYIRLSEERERKFKRLTKTISSAQSTKPQGRQVKMAFIHSVAKPPRDVRIKQEIHGTAVQQPLPKCSVKPVHDSRPRQMPKESFSRISTTSTSTSSTSQDPRKKTKVAPMMAKSLKAFKKQFVAGLCITGPHHGAVCGTGAGGGTEEELVWMTQDRNEGVNVPGQKLDKRKLTLEREEEKG